MFLLCVFVYFCVIGQHGCSQPDKNFNELRHAEWKCDAVCVGSGGKAAFDLKNKICKCTLDKNTDEIERQMLLKNAELARIPVVITKDIVKRQTNSDSTKEHLLGQRSPSRIIAPRIPLRITTRRPFQLTPSRAFAPPHRITSITPRTNMNVQQRLEAIQKRLNDRRRNRARAGPHLQQRAGFPDESQPNLMERLRQMQKERQEKQRSRTAAFTTAAPNVAAPAPRTSGYTSHSAANMGTSRNVNINSNSKSNIDHNAAKIHAEIITQDPSLYDKDD